MDASVEPPTPTNQTLTLSQWSPKVPTPPSSCGFSGGRRPPSVGKLCEVGGGEKETHVLGKALGGGGGWIQHVCPTHRLLISESRMVCDELLSIALSPSCKECAFGLVVSQTILCLTKFILIIYQWFWCLTNFIRVIMKYIFIAYLFSVINIDTLHYKFGQT
jgi:hypothetical protein